MAYEGVIYSFCLQVTWSVINVWGGVRTQHATLVVHWSCNRVQYSLYEHVHPSWLHRSADSLPWSHHTVFLLGCKGQTGVWGLWCRWFCFPTAPFVAFTPISMYHDQLSQFTTHVPQTMPTSSIDIQFQQARSVLFLNLACVCIVCITIVTVCTLCNVYTSNISNIYTDQTHTHVRTHASTS